MADPFPSFPPFPSCPSFTSFITQEEFNHFHKIDRELYTILVINLCRDPLECYHIIALWIWLERMGYKNVVKNIMALPAILINWLADEAVICINCTNDDTFSLSAENNDIPLTQGLMEKEISLQFFNENRLIASQGVAKVVKEVCIRALSDIMKLATERNAAQISTSLKNLSLGNVVQPSWNQGNGVRAEDRTLFVTFSKGYPVFEGEMREYFTRFYGDCVESLHMQEVEPNQQALYARIVFRSTSIIQRILIGTSSIGASGKAKFTINGKHVWARKFIPRRLRTSQLPPLPPQPQPPLPPS